MFLCAMDGKLYDNDTLSKNVVFTLDKDYGNTSKDYKFIKCSSCWGLINIKYKLTDDNKFIVPLEKKIKLYKISSYNIDNITDKDKIKDNNKTLINDIIKVMKSNEKKIAKKSKF